MIIFDLHIINHHFKNVYYYSFITKWVRKFVPVPGMVYLKLIIRGNRRIVLITG